MNTGENLQGLRQITDFTRLLSLFVLLLHFYLSCRRVFEAWGLTAPLVDRLAVNFGQLPFLDGALPAKGSALLLLAVSLLGVKGRKNEKLGKGVILACLLSGLLLYAGSHALPRSASAPLWVLYAYLAASSLGYLLLLSGGTLLSRRLSLPWQNEVFNTLNETFPQEERLLQNEYSVNLPARYRLRGQERNSWINVINPFRALLVIGTPGAGKSYFVIRHVITQHIQKGFALFLYDFKYDDLSRIAYNTLLQQAHRYSVPPRFYLIHFDDLTRSHRCNPLDPDAMHDITDATESSRTIMLVLDQFKL